MFKSKEEFKEQYIRRLVESFGCAVEDTHPTEKYMVLGKMVRDYANVNWKDTKAAIKHTQAKQIYYFSIEFLLGKMLTNNLKNLGIYDMVVDGLKELGIDIYRFSISWARLYPHGDEKTPNEEGIKFYDHIFKEVHKAGMKIFLTMNHYAVPLYLVEHYGGWTNRKLGRIH